MRLKNRGFTLLELMIAISLMLIVMLMLRTMFVSAQQLYVTASKRADVYSQARTTLDIMESDLMRLRTGDNNEQSLNVRSLTIDDYSDPSAARNADNMYTEMSDWSSPDPDQTPKVKAFLSFLGAATWYDESLNKFVSGNARIYYYLRKRKAVDGQPDGAYLVRRIIPVRSLAEITQISKGAQVPDIAVTEEELCSYVYGVRTFVDDTAAFQMGAYTGNNAQNIMPEAIASTANARWLWQEKDQYSAIVKNVKKSKSGVTLELPVPLNERVVQFGGAKRSNLSQDRNFVSTTADYPAALMFNLTIVDRNFERVEGPEGSGTYRTFSRAVLIPSADAPRKLDDLDRRLMTK